MIYTGKTKNLGVIGYPIKHSLSPVIQNAAIAKANLDYAYIAMPIAPENLEIAIKGLKASGFCGFNVTIPHKVAIMQYMNEIDEAAKIIGAVNTVAIRDGKFYGYNTDAIGFINPLIKANFILENKTAVILGAGGACRAIICGLIQHGVKNIVLGVRNQAKGQKLAKSFAKLKEVQAFDWHDEQFINWLGRADLLVNTTPLGMSPNIDAMPPIYWEDVNEKALVYDIIYIPAKTKFLLEAEKHGHIILNGEKMLAEQGAASLNYWTGANIDVDNMTEVLHKYLAEHN